MQSGRNVRGVIFDYGGVLAEPLGIRRRYELERSVGLPRGALRSFFKLGVFFDEKEWDLAARGHLSEPKFWAEIAERLPHPPDAKESDSFFRALFVSPIRPRMLQLLRALRPLAPLALLTNATGCLATAPHLLAEFDHVLVSAELGVKKPDERAFELALDALACSPSSALFIDDASYNVQAARQLGLRAHQYRRPGELLAFLRRSGLKLDDV